MRKLITLIVLLVAIGGSAAIAQTSGNGRTPSASGGRATTVLPAPVGHRQPRADEVPSEKTLSDPNDPLNREDAELDKKIKSICRGC